ncbi:peroxiredoxin-like family protein [Kribbella sp.]|uniref:peroxiredoxin-like family protein n=1 Tax=Kribbella sp. TaxID=1871183 RepID=UPI002D3828B9|nr:peroxiredoxin-like family protein [Kribbella sp.]HZX01450.1 peroxiredoxin-like family protein [Kribbella sp.]
MTATPDAERVTIAERVHALHEGMTGQLPEAALQAFGAEQTGLDARGVPGGVAAAGSVVPDVPLLDVHGDQTSLYAALAGAPAVIVLYRGAWCPYCNLALRAYQEDLVPVLAERGIGLLAISPQKPDGSLSMQEKNELTFTVLSDPGNRIAGALGVLTAPTDEVRAVQGSLGLDLRETNADGTTAVPMPTVLLTDATGRLRWLDVHPNYTTRTEVSDIITALGTLA